MSPIGSAAVMAKPAASALPPGWDPRTQVTALHVMWASDPDWTNPGDGNPVDSWRNHSGGGDPANTLTARPTFRASIAALNNRATIEFASASSQWLHVDVANIAQTWKVVIVGKAGTVGTGERFVGFGAAAAACVGDTNANAWSFNTQGTLLTGGTSDTNAHVFRATAAGASSQLWVDESSVASGNAGSSSVVWLSIGAGNNGGASPTAFLNGHVAFVGIYAGATSDASLSALCDDLQTYYGTP